jgi:hypothetical protein
MHPNMLEQPGLGIGRAGDKNSAGIFNRFSDRVEIIMTRGSVSASDGIRLVMDMPVG